MKKILITALASLLALTAVTFAPATTSAKQPGWFVDEDKLPFDAFPGAEAYWGVRSGAGYLMEVPDNWNGDLVLYAHGYRGEGLELTVEPPPIRPWLIANGYAWAASSYRANGYVPGTGARDTHALIGEFRGRIGKPDRVFITGFSMGGHVTAAAIEQWPNSFDGAVPMCGVMGDNELFDYFQDLYLLGEHFAGNEPEVPTPDGYTDPFPTGGWVSTAAALGLFGGPTPPNGQQFKDAVEQLTGGERPIFDEGYFGPNGAAFPFFFGQATTSGGRENLETVYQLDNDPALSDEELALNEAIPRIAPEPQFRHPNGLGRTPGSTNDSPYIAGDFDIPVVSMHTLGELFVPFHMQQIYAERAAATGNDDMLVVRAIRDVGHCGFSYPELVEAFADMVAWADTGVRPAGDDILDPAAVADPAFGCMFTRGDREDLPPCP